MPQYFLISIKIFLTFCLVQIRTMAMCDRLSILDVSVAPEHISSVAKSAAKKIRFLFRSRRFFMLLQLLFISVPDRVCIRGEGPPSIHSLATLVGIRKRANRQSDLYCFPRPIENAFPHFPYFIDTITACLVRVEVSNSIQSLLHT